jgi:hypothetical protein
MKYEVAPARRLLRDETSMSFADDPGIRRLLIRLDDLERKTSPDRSESETDKDGAAAEALTIAFELVSILAGWAIDHKVGLAAKGLDNIPTLLSTEARTVEYQALRESIDSHMHETYAASQPKLTGRETRGAIASLLRGVRHYPLLNLSEPLAEALEALDFGETLPLVTSEKNGRKRKFTELRMQAYCLACIEYLQALGRPKYKLQEIAAEAFGVSADTVRGWEYRLRSEWGPYRLLNLLSRAKRCGIAGKANLDGRFEALFGEAALREYGANFKAAQRKKKSA